MAHTFPVVVWGQSALEIAKMDLERLNTKRLAEIVATD